MRALALLCTMASRGSLILRRQQIVPIISVSLHQFPSQTFWSRLPSCSCLVQAPNFVCLLRRQHLTSPIILRRRRKISRWGLDMNAEARGASPASHFLSQLDLTVCLHNRSQRLACRILRELAREPLLIYELLNAGVAEYLSRLLPKLRENSIDRLLEVRQDKRCGPYLSSTSVVASFTTRLPDQRDRYV